MEKNAEPVKEIWMVTNSKEGTKGFWTKIGALWSAKDGSLSGQLNAFPVDGRINIRDPKSSTPQVGE